jgi:hypothetical protein
LGVTENQIFILKVLGLNSDDLRLAVEVLGMDAQRGYYGERGNERIGKVKRMFNVFSKK